MSHDESPQSILVVGSIPHPIGGVTNATWRLLHALGERGHRLELLDMHPGPDKYTLPPGTKVHNLSRVRRLAYPVGLLPWLAFGGWDVVHFNFSSIATLRYFGASLTRSVRPGRRNVLTLHHGDQRAEYQKMHPMLRGFVRRGLARFDTITALSPLQESFFRDTVGLGVGQVRLTPGYVPPPAMDFQTAGPDARFASLRQIDGTLLVTSGYPTKIYGYEHAFELVERHGEDYDLHLAVCLYGTPDSPTYDRTIRDRVRSHPRMTLLEFLDYPAFAELLDLSDLYLRPSYTDSTCITIRDCVANGLPVVASDCVERPTGSVLFETGNQEAFEAATLDALGRVDELRLELRGLPSPVEQDGMVAALERIPNAAPAT